jgi:hypothetical protein
VQRIAQQAFVHDWLTNDNQKSNILLLPLKQVRWIPLQALQCPSLFQAQSSNLIDLTTKPT